MWNYWTSVILKKVEMSLGLLRLWEMKLQWHDKMKAGEAVVDSVSAAISQALRSDVLQQIIPPSPFCLCVSLCLSGFVSVKNTIYFSLRPLSLCLCLVNSVINHPVTVTELLLIVILQLPCLIVFIWWFSPFHWTYIKPSFRANAEFQTFEWTLVKSSLWKEKLNVFFNKYIHFLPSLSFDFLPHSLGAVLLGCGGEAWRIWMLIN